MLSLEDRAREFADQLTLTVNFKCCSDGDGRWLAVEHSKFAVYPGPKASGEPLFRYDYEREIASDLPSAHLQVHAHRDAMAYVMSGAGKATRRGKSRAQRSGVPRMQELHFPLGGHRFRPGLEDILLMLICEVGVDHPPDTISTLTASRNEWRLTQVRVVVRDAPQVAAEALRLMGYEVIAPADEPEPNRSGRLYMS